MFELIVLTPALPFPQRKPRKTCFISLQIISFWNGKPEGISGKCLQDLASRHGGLSGFAEGENQRSGQQLPVVFQHGWPQFGWILVWLKLIERMAYAKLVLWVGKNQCVWKCCIFLGAQVGNFETPRDFQIRWFMKGVLPWSPTLKHAKHDIVIQFVYISWSPRHLTRRPRTTTPATSSNSTTSSDLSFTFSSKAHVFLLDKNHPRPPKWNEQVGAFVLNFNKRVTQVRSLRMGEDWMFSNSFNSSHLKYMKVVDFKVSCSKNSLLSWSWVYDPQVVFLWWNGRTWVVIGDRIGKQKTWDTETNDVQKTSLWDGFASSHGVLVLHVMHPYTSYTNSCTWFTTDS